LVPCYKRPEYTEQCIKALEEAQEYPDVTFCLVDDGSQDITEDILRHANLPKEVIVHSANKGLRSCLIAFIEWARQEEFDILGVIGNDCLVPKDWLKTILAKFDTTNADILSPNVLPSNAAFTIGKEDTEGLGYRPSKIVGGLWFMRFESIVGIDFEHIDLPGIKGAFNILYQIILETDPRIGWLPEVAVQDIGHWSGAHPNHIKTEEHRAYYEEVGRGIAW
jgi:glycosyltransferase involved in cell wall biosynthesis